MKLLVTGAAGFIGSTLSHRLLEGGHEVLGIDNLNAYYEVSLKTARLDRLLPKPGFQFEKVDIADREKIPSIFQNYKPNVVVNLAAQAGVRYSLQNPHAYVDSNLVGFVNILEGCRHAGVQHLVYASSSSVYGANEKLPFSTADDVNHPVSLYAATKRANELLAHTYSHLFQLPTTGLRFFTVYGPWGRPDMALFLFTKNILEGKPIDVFNFGKHRRDFTYIDDIVEGIVRVIQNPAQPNGNWDPKAPAKDSSRSPYRLYNIGNNQPVWLDEFIEAIESALGKKAVRTLLPMQAGDVAETFADVESLTQATGFKPKTTIQEGVQKFMKWYLDYYKVRL